MASVVKILILCLFIAGVNGLKAAAEYMRSFAFEDIEGGEVPTHSERGTIDPEYIRRQVN